MSYCEERVGREAQSSGVKWDPICCSDHKIVVFSLCMYRCQEKLVLCSYCNTSKNTNNICLNIYCYIRLQLDFCQEGSLQFSSLQRLTIIDCCWLEEQPIHGTCKPGKQIYKWRWRWRGNLFFIQIHSFNLFWMNGWVLIFFLQTGFWTIYTATSL